MSLNKYALYERSVQSPKTHVEWFVQLYKEMHQEYPKRLREDFCGTFQISCEWVKRNRQNTSLGIDLDPEPLDYGKKRNYAKLTSDQKRRLQIRRANVLKPTRQKQDLIYAGNFSFFIFKRRSELLHYFQSCHRSLRSHGTLLLELAGGPGMIACGKETKTVRLRKDQKFVYVWDQKRFDPIHRQGQYAIHFRLPNGKTLKNAFEYDWRIWTLPETQDVLREAGFSKTSVYWETKHKDRGTGEYVASDVGDNAYSWIAYLVAVR